MNTDKNGWDGRAGSPLPAARATMCDGAHPSSVAALRRVDGVTRPARLQIIRVHPFFSVLEAMQHAKMEILPTFNSQP